jgi:hypothetical protein
LWFNSLLTGKKLIQAEGDDGEETEDDEDEMSDASPVKSKPKLRDVRKALRKR